MTLRAWVQDFQTLIAGTIGFAGVIITLVLNARQAREQRREERHHERQTLRAALTEELRINRESLVHATEEVKDTPEASGYHVPTDATDDVYRAFTDRIGLLSPEEVRKVMYAYLTLRSYDAKLFLIGDSRGGGHVWVRAEMAPLLTRMNRDLIDAIDKAVGVLKRGNDQQ